MTCTVGIVKNGIAYIGADSGVFYDGEDQYYVTNRKKVIRKKFKHHEIIMGFAGDWKVWDLIEMWETQAIVYSPKKGTKHFLHKVLIPNLQEVLQKDKKLEFEYLIALEGEIYNVSSDYSVMPIPVSGHAIGSGAEPARGVLYYIHEQKINVDPEKLLKSALKAANKTVTTVKGPYHVINS